MVAAYCFALECVLLIAMPCRLGVFCLAAVVAFGTATRVISDRPRAAT